MAKYRTKPIVVEAEVFYHGRGLEDGYRVIESSPDGLTGGVYEIDKKEFDPNIHTVSYAFIKTYAGNMAVSEGDWIVTDTKGERSHMKAEVFEARYEPVE